MSGTGDHSAELMAGRKSAHLGICLDDATYRVESGRTRFDEVHPVHRSLPEIDADQVDTSTEFLGSRITMPVFISSMTGGSAEGYRTNKDLARIAAELGIPVGMGSIRILLRKPEVIEDFTLKKHAPSVPVFANIGGVQLPSVDHESIYRLIDTLAVDGIAVHLNPGQELFQAEGDRDFSGVLDGIARFIAGSPVPVIVKETGFGINPREVRDLLNIGATYVDIAGSGGTNWARVEAYREDTPDAMDTVVEFDHWGLPTALVLAALGRTTRGVLASGGVRSGMDVVRALALGADAVGMALPFIRALTDRGIPGAVDFGRRVQYVIRNAMVLSGCRRVEELHSAPLWLDHSLRTDAAALLEACANGGNGR